MYGRCVNLAKHKFVYLFVIYIFLSSGVLQVYVITQTFSKLGKMHAISFLNTATGI
jgi:hypothetical protein